MMERRRVVVDGQSYFVDRSHPYPRDGGRCVIIRKVHPRTNLTKPDGNLTWIHPSYNEATFYEQSNGVCRDRIEDKEKYRAGETREVIECDEKWFPIYKEAFE